MVHARAERHTLARLHVLDILHRREGQVPVCRRLGLGKELVVVILVRDALVVAAVFAYLGVREREVITCLRLV